MQKLGKVNPDILNFRGKEDRRSFEPQSHLPVVDAEYKLVKKDRRIIPDRRIANIQVKNHFLHINRKF